VPAGEQAGSFFGIFFLSYRQIPLSLSLSHTGFEPDKKIFESILKEW